MPEVLTKHPEVVIQVLESGGAKCGDGLPQNILKQCPRDAFCALPGGETCVYGVADVGKMTQIGRADLAGQICDKSSGGCATSDLAPSAGSWVLVAFVAGLALGRLTRRRASQACRPT